MLGLMASSVLGMMVWQSYLKRVLFSHNPQFKSSPDSHFYSPVCGEVVYILKNPVEIHKGEDRFVQIPFLKMLNNHYQVGIFMSQYDNHHIITPGCMRLSNLEMIGYNSDSPMLTFLDKFLASFGIKFFDWLERSASFISVNQQYFFHYENGVYSVLTMDKVVNKFDIYLDKSEQNSIGDRKVLGFVKRGSQMDFFIPRSYDISHLNVGDKITFDSILFDV